MPALWQNLPLILLNNKNKTIFNKRSQTMKKNLVHIASQLQSTKGRFVLCLLTIALFVISAGAPNATIGIGK
jgi:hypothetical protein